MLQRPLRDAPHLIVVGNLKGGSGKTTMAMHLAVGLLKRGQRVGTIDLDADQQSLTCYVENRRIWSHHRGTALELPDHRTIAPAHRASLDDNEAEDLAAFEAVLYELAGRSEFIVIDTPSTDTYLMRLAHLLADTTVTPLQDSFLDLTTLARTDPVTHEVTRTGHYAAIVTDGRKPRLDSGLGASHWLVVHNRCAGPSPVRTSVRELGLRIGFRDLEGCADRPLYGELFAHGLTAFDLADDRALDRPRTDADAAARQEMERLLDDLRLPLDERALRHAAAHAQWFACRAAPLDTDDLLADV